MKRIGIIGMDYRSKKVGEVVKRIGIIGMDYRSISYYYNCINEKLDFSDKLLSREFVVRHLNFDECREMLRIDDWGSICMELLRAFNYLFWEGSGCDYIVIASNTLHNWVEEAENRAFGVLREECYPLVHISDCVVEECRKNNLRRVALLGTRFVMDPPRVDTEPWYYGYDANSMRERLEKNGLEVVDLFLDHQIEEIDQIIFDYRCRGLSNARRIDDILFKGVVNWHNIDGIVLGSTGLEMMLKNHLSPNRLFSPTNLSERYGVHLINPMEAHIEKVVELCLSK